MASYIWGANTGVQSPEELQRRRDMLAALASRSRAPRDVGEGLTTLGQAIAYRMAQGKLAKQESAGRAEADNLFNSIFSGAGDASASGVTPSVSGSVPPGANVDPINSRVAQGFAPFEGGSKNYADAIASIESRGSGDYAAVGPNTGKGRAYGRYQVMDFNIGPWTEKHLGRRLTPQEFLASPEAQDKVFNGEFGSYVQKYGNPQDAASAWFTGKPLAQGANRADVNGMTGSAYVNKFTNALGPQMASANPQAAIAQALAARQPAQAPVAAPGGGNDLLKTIIRGDFSGQPQTGGAVPTSVPPQAGPTPAAVPPQAASPAVPTPQRVAQATSSSPYSNVDPRLMQALSNRYLSPGQRAVLEATLKQQLAASQPKEPMTLSPGETIYDPQTGKVIFQAPSKTPDSVMALDERAKRAGLQSGTPEYNKFMVAGGKEGVTVNVGGNEIPGLNKVPTGYSYVYDQNGRVKFDENGLPMVRPLPGGPEDTTKQDALKQQSKETSTNLVMDEIDIAKQIITANPWTSTGLAGGLLSNIDQTTAGALKNRLETIKANIGFDKLQAMRDASPTGGALGQVSEFENRLLQSVYGSLIQSQDSANLLYNLERLQNVYSRIVNQGIPDKEAQDLYRQEALRNTGVDQKENATAPAQPVPSPAVPAMPQAAPTTAPQRDGNLIQTIPSMSVEDLQRLDMKNMSVEELKAASQRYRELAGQQ